MRKATRTQITLSATDIQMVDEIKEKFSYLKNNTDVFRFLLCEYFEKEKEILGKLSNIHYETMLLKHIFREMLPQIYAIETPDEIENKAKEKLRKQLRKLN